MQYTAALSAILLALPFTIAHPTGATTSLKPRFVSGQCGIHVVQWQKNENGVGGDYQYDVRIYDAIQAEIGGTNRLDIPDLQTASVDSQLPNTVDISSGEIDDDPVVFAYAGQSWQSSEPQCSVGGYENGNRDMDCSFSC